MPDSDTAVSVRGVHNLEYRRRVVQFLAAAVVVLAAVLPCTIVAVLQHTASSVSRSRSG